MGACFSPGRVVVRAQTEGPFQQSVVNGLQDLVEDKRPVRKGRSKKPLEQTTPLPCLLVTSRQANTKQGIFEEKPLEGKVLRCPKAGDMSYGIGFVCQKGAKLGGIPMVNQDSFFVIQIGDINIFGVFDGFGQQGETSSGYAAANLPKHFAKDASLISDPLGALGRALSKTHHEILWAADRAECEVSGTTATLVAFSGRTSSGAGAVLYTAHVGDSRAVMARATESGRLVAVDLTKDHRPGDQVEKERIEACGGEVRNVNGKDRVYVKNDLVPGLTTSRCLGDTLAGRIGVCGEPCLKEVSVGRDDRFFVACSDGVWEFISSQEAVEIIGRFSPSEAHQAAEALAEEARKRWLTETGTLVDDITVLCAWLEPAILNPSVCASQVQAMVALDYASKWQNIPVATSWKRTKILMSAHPL